MYSYRSPLVSRSRIGMSDSMSTALTNRPGVGTVNRAPSMCWEYVEPSTPRVRRKGNAAVHDLVHHAGVEVLELRPPQIRPRPALLVDAVGEDWFLDRLAGAVGLVLGEGVQVVEPPNEE